MNYATKVGKPTAHITKKKSRLKVYNGHIVFLNDKDNFEFEIHNPKQHPVLCKIKLNGEYISNSGVVLKPGQRVFLERFLDSNNKFEFSTYEVKDTPQNRSAIDLNGDVLVEFYDEQRIRTYSNGSGWITTSNSLGNNNMFTVTNTGTPYLGGLTYTTSNVGLSTLTTAYANYTNTVETGRVEKGDISDQSFTNSYEEFNYFTSHTVKFKILPLSTKNKNVEEIRQYCTECGTKVKKNYKFCPSCGNKI
jgi:hypothetical protein